MVLVIVVVIVVVAAAAAVAVVAVVAGGSGSVGTIFQHIVLNSPGVSTVPVSKGARARAFSTRAVDTGIGDICGRVTVNIEERAS